MEYEFQLAGISFEREKEYFINYKEIVLLHKFYAEFIVFDKIILEVKAISDINDKSIAQAINYLSASKCKLSLIVNFGELKLNYRRIII